MAEDYSMENVYRSIGENKNLRKVVDGIREVYSASEGEFFMWWYDSKNKGLGNKSPHELCGEGEEGKKYLEKILMDFHNPSHGW